MNETDKFGLPINLGNFYSSNANINAKNQTFKMSNYATDTIAKIISDKLNTELNTYTAWQLLQFQADYFTNLVPFYFNNHFLTEQIYKLIRCAIIYGSAALWVTSRGVVPFYINKLITDNLFNYPEYLECCPVDYVFSTAAKNLPIDNKIIFNNNNEYHEDDFKNIYIFKTSSTEWGGLIRWMPFLRQFENLLKMLYTHSFSFLKFLTYEVKDMNFLANELRLFFDTNTPFLINLGDDLLINNRFKEFNFNNTDKTAFFTYLDKFLEIYYNLIGRRLNSDKKPERNITGEVYATQENFNVLQNELKQYIILMLNWVSFKTGEKYYLNEFNFNNEIKE